MAKEPKLSKNVVKRKPNRSKSLRKIKSVLLDKIGSLDKKDRDKVRQQINLMLNMEKNGDKEQWRGLLATPPGGFLEAVLSAFYNKTDIPLEIPFFTAMSYVSAHLLKEKIVFEFDGIEHSPEIWTVILAESGAGKTFSSKLIERATGSCPDFPDSASAAKFIQNLSENPQSFWLRDEFGQFLKSLNEMPQFAELKDYLLRVYDNSKIERNTKNDTIKIENPALVILGITVLSNFIEQMSFESLIDGFAQRFSYVIAEGDPNRKVTDFPLYQMKDEVEKIKIEWDKLTNSIKHKKYYITDSAIEGFKNSFRLLYHDDLPASFFRRILFKSFKYALVYHFLLGKSSNEIDQVDMGWAARLSKIHLDDAMKLLKGHDKSDLQNLLEKAEEVIVRLEKKGVPITPRNLIRNMRQISNTSEAKGLLNLLEIPF